MRHGVVASGHPLTSEAAAEVLRAGGNAFDAVVAAGCAAAVCEPALTSLGGGGFLLARPADGAARLFDFFVDTPGRGLEAGAREPHFVPLTIRFPGQEQVFNVGLGSVAVPGNVAGFVHAQRALGRLPLADVVAPARALAREGVPVGERQAYVLSLLEPVMTLTQRGRALWASEGRYVAAGDRVAMPELADFLERLPHDGVREFYQGEVAAGIEREMRDGHGLLTRADLAAYRVVERAPLEVAYRGRRLLTKPPPAFGGALLAEGLALFERAGAPERFGSAAHLRRLAETLREVEARRTAPAATRGTTHTSVLDRDGNAASLTTSNGEASGYLAPGTGVMLNNMLGEDDLHPEGFHVGTPGERVASMMSPSVLLERGAVRLVVGSGGSKRIRSAIHQVVSNVVDFGMDVADAVEAPRVHWDGEALQAEPGFDPAALAALREGSPGRDAMQTHEWEVRDLYFGGVHAVSGDGRGAGDPRRGGAAVVA